MQILIVEDDPTTRQSLVLPLERKGFEVLVAEDGREALEVLHESSCRLVITDWEMPRLSGLEFCRTLRQRTQEAYVYVLMLTCKEGSNNIIEAMDAGVDDFITKPVGVAELLARIRCGQRVLSLESREMVIFSMAKLAESRDPETGSHLERVREYSRRLSEQLRQEGKFPETVTPGFVRMIHLTAPLHDIGKVGIPDCVLLKPGRLDDHEFGIMKTHAAIGARTLQAALKEYPEAEFLRMAVDIAWCHHEKVDGNGYPRRLAGEAIPLCARIFALADVYDALVSKRVYKEAFSHDVALGIIRDGSGTHFDPTLVDSFMACNKDMLKIHHRFADKPCEDSAA
ncbi:MAG: response regulator [Planctomycetota bacterium]